MTSVKSTVLGKVRSGCRTAVLRVVSGVEGREDETFAAFSDDILRLLELEGDEDTNARIREEVRVCIVIRCV